MDVLCSYEFEEFLHLLLSLNYIIKKGCWKP